MNSNSTGSNINETPEVFPVQWPKITQAEFDNRMVRFKQQMETQSIDLAVIYSNLLDPSGVRYFSDFSPVNESAAMVIPLLGEPIVCSGFACHEWSRFKSKIGNIRVLPEIGEVSDVIYDLEGQIDFRTLFEEIKAKYSVKRIGTIGQKIFPQVIYGKMASVFSGAEITAAEKLMYALRVQKSPDEIACMRKVCEIITSAFEYAVPRIVPGVTELEIQADLESQMLRLGAEGFCIAFAPMIQSGPINSHLCMNRNSLRQVQASEIIAVGAGACYEGYNGVINTPVVCGDVPDEISDAVKVAQEALSRVADRMKPGVSAAELYKVYTDFLTAKGYREYCPYASVHSTGLMECEDPFFGQESGAVILEDMTVCIDAYLKGMPWGSFRLEETFMISNSGAELLTTFNREYIKAVYK